MRGTCLATCLLLALPACGAGEAEPLVDAERQEVIDVAAGTYRGVPLARRRPPEAGSRRYSRHDERRQAVNVAFLGGIGKRPLPPGWTKETLVAVLGGADVDLSESPPGENARLRAIAILGGVKIIVAPGTRVSTSGFSLLGGRDVKVSQAGDGPEIRMSLWAFLGGVEVRET